MRERAVDLSLSGIPIEVFDVAIFVALGRRGVAAIGKQFGAEHAFELARRAVSRFLETAAQRDSLYCFPNKLEDILALEYALAHNPADARAPYYLGCLWYDKRQYDRAAAMW